jgi:predicted nucleotidyltransferase
MSDADIVFAREINRDELVAELRALRPIFVREGVTSMSLFGSRARGDNRPDSDVDVAIKVDPNVKFSLLDVVGVKHLIEDNVGLSGNIFMHRSLSPDFLAELHRDGVEIF